MGWNKNDMIKSTLGYNALLSPSGKRMSFRALALRRSNKVKLRFKTKGKEIHRYFIDNNILEGVTIYADVCLTW
mgnify:CR=1 FL=1